MDARGGGKHFWHGTFERALVLAERLNRKATKANAMRAMTSQQRQKALREGRYVVVDIAELDRMISGRSIDAAPYILKGLMADWERRCGVCKKRVVAVLHETEQPSPDMRVCHSCATKKPVTA